MIAAALIVVLGSIFVFLAVIAIMIQTRDPGAESVQSQRSEEQISQSEGD